MKKFRFRKPWPFCQETITVGSVVNPSFFPVVTNYATLFGWCWRVRSWKAVINIDYTLNDTPSPGETTSVHLEGEITVSQSQRLVGTPPADEHGLTCDPTWSSEAPLQLMTSSWSNTLGDSGSAVNASLGIYIAQESDNIDYGLTDLAHWMYRTAGGLLPALQVVISTQSNDTGFSGSAFINNAFTDYPASPSLSATFDGLTLPLFIQVPEASLFSGSVVITPVEYWAYDPDDGLGAIYSTTTGAPLRAPFSV